MHFNLLLQSGQTGRAVIYTVSPAAHTCAPRIHEVLPQKPHVTCLRMQDLAFTLGATD